MRCRLRTSACSSPDEEAGGADEEDAEAEAEAEAGCGGGGGAVKEEEEDSEEPRVLRCKGPFCWVPPLFGVVGPRAEKPSEGGARAECPAEAKRLRRCIVWCVCVVRWKNERPLKTV